MLMGKGIFQRCYQVAILLVLFCLVSCEKQYGLHGYVEGRFTYLSSSYGGRLVQLFVQRGELVKKNDPLFRLEVLPEAADLKAAEANLEQTQANLKNILKGKRPTELAEIEAQIEKVKANISFLEKEYQRHKTLVVRSALDKQTLDRTISDLAQSRAELHNLEATLATAKLAARTDEITAARAEVQSKQSIVVKEQWKVEEKSINAPTDAEVFDTFYRVGEQVPANKPVLSILAPLDIKAVFFVPEVQLGAIHLKQSIFIGCDSCSTKIAATINFISPKAEFTPPVIYSQQSRAKLVYRVEAIFSRKDIDKVHPGQPIDIYLDGQQS